MFCSELLLFLSIVVLLSNTGRNLMGFVVLSSINGINLLHGTRIFFITACITFGLYLFIRGKLRFKTLIWLSAGLFAVAYSVFLLRSHATLNENAFSFERIVSPVMYESIFSQLSLIGVIQHPTLWGQQIVPSKFFLDMLWFTVPRFLLPGKEQLLYVSRFGDLSPMGAFSGYAQGLLYFGVLFPVFYFVLGVAADWLLRHARYSQLWSVMYVEFTCDFMLHIMRDGYDIPVKMLANNIISLVFIAYFVSPQLHSYPMARLKNVREISAHNLEGADPVS